MRKITALVGIAMALSLPSSMAAAKKLPDTWDNLHLVPAAKKMAAVYLLEGADFRAYNKVMLDPTEVAFRKNWQRDAAVGRITISDRQANKIAEAARTGMEETFAKAYTAAGYSVVTEPGPDVLRVKTFIADLYITAPESQQIGRSTSYSVEAGEATFVIEIRDSMTGAVLGRAVDKRVAGDAGGIATMRNSATNRADFLELFKGWAKRSANALAILKEYSPVDPENLAPPAK